MAVITQAQELSVVGGAGERCWEGHKLRTVTVAWIEGLKFQSVSMFDVRLRGENTRRGKERIETHAWSGVLVVYVAYRMYNLQLDVYHDYWVLNFRYIVQEVLAEMYIKATILIRLVLQTSLYISEYISVLVRYSKYPHINGLIRYCLEPLTRSNSASKSALSLPLRGEHFFVDTTFSNDGDVIARDIKDKHARKWLFVAKKESISVSIEEVHDSKTRPETLIPPSSLPFTS